MWDRPRAVTARDKTNDEAVAEGSTAEGIAVDIDVELAGLARAAVAGDARAFRAFVDRITPILWRLALRLVDDRDRADDLVQQTIVRVWRALPGLRDFKAVRAFACATLRHVAIDDARAAARRRSVSFDRQAASEDGEQQALAERLAGDVPAPDDVLQSKDAVALVRTAIDSLADVDRMVLLLCDVDGLSYDDAAVALGTKTGTVASRLSRAREKLAKKVLAMARPRRSPWPWGRS